MVMMIIIVPATVPAINVDIDIGAAVHVYLVDAGVAHVGGAHVALAVIDFHVPLAATTVALAVTGLHVLFAVAFTAAAPALAGASSPVRELVE